MKKIISYWNKRFVKNLGCTNDFRLNIYEIKQIIKFIKNGKSILELGSGNGELFNIIKKKFKIKYYLGIDFSNLNVNYCQKNYTSTRKNNINFKCFDLNNLHQLDLNKKFDLIISKRTIQNLLSTKSQIKAIESAGKFLKKKGKMILVESSHESLQNINKLRKLNKLPEIKTRFFNYFLKEKKISSYKYKNLRFIKSIPFSSDYYYITRIIYRLYAKNLQKIKFPQIIHLSRLLELLKEIMLQHNSLKLKHLFL
jgi:ubiquinone/menaquinone biosynthesis C-methylase UbiE